MTRDINKVESALLAAAMALAAQVPLAQSSDALALPMGAAPEFLTAPILVQTEPCFNAASIKPPPRKLPMRVRHHKHC